MKVSIADLAAGYRKLTGYEAGRKAGHDEAMTMVGKVVVRVYRLHLPNCGLRNKSVVSEGTWLPVVEVEKKYAKAALDRHIDG